MVRKLRIRRRGYIAERRVDGKVVRYRVKPTTYYRKDVGTPGRGKKVIPPLEEGELKKHGYSLSAPEEVRHRALVKSVEEDGYKTTVSRLIALQVLFKRTNPHYSRIAKKDREWLVEKFGKG